MDSIHDSTDLSALGGIAITKYVGVSAVAICLYELILNLGDEVEFVWNKPLRFGQMLYIMNRYVSSTGLCLTVAFLLYPPRASHFCNIWPYFILAQFGMSTLLIQVVLVARVCAIYNHSLIVRVTAIVGCVAVVIETLGVGLAMILVGPWSRQSIPEISLDICVFRTAHIASWRYAYWIYPILYQAMLFLLVVNQTWRDPSFRSKRSLIGVIVRDSTLTFLWNFALQLVSIFIWRFNADGGLTDTPAMVGNALDVALATRLLLNMWSRYYNPDLELSSLPDTAPRLEIAIRTADPHAPATSWRASDSFWAA